jgi:hypothetical protein
LWQINTENDMNNTPFEIKDFQQGEVLLHLAGYRDADECVIERVTVAGSDQNLLDLFEVSTVCDMADRVDLQLSREARQHHAEARAERHEWNRDFGVAA